jgi:hypothetical protein
MKNTSFQSIPGFMFLLLLAFIFGCKKEGEPATQSQPNPSSSVNADTQFLSQTRTPDYLNNLNNWQDYYINAYPDAQASDVAADDDKFAYSYKLNSVNWYASLSLQGFGFTIPDTATITKITLTVRRFKKGDPTIGDIFLTLMQRYNCDLGTCRYGVEWTDQDTYPGKTYPDTETEYVFSQSGRGNNGGYNHNVQYNWTPAIVNHTFFGVRIDVAQPLGQGEVAVYYDMVTVAVEYYIIT